MSHSNRKIVVGVAGGIAAYKACQLIRLFKEAGDDVTVVPTEAALKFVGKATFEALSGNPVSATVFEGIDEVRHVHIGQQADAIVVAPATADLLARVAAGRADDLLTATLLMATCPVILAPAMHTEMWENLATQANVHTLRERGLTVLQPAHGRLTGADTGPGRLLEPPQIKDLAETVIAGHTLFPTLTGKKIVITAGGTKEAVDPVRYIGNHSSGRQGFALGEVAAQRGAEVVIIAGAVDKLETPAGARIINVQSARDMAQAVADEVINADAVIMAAAVADFRPMRAAESKLKKGSEADAGLQTIHLVENPDILAGVVAQRSAGELSSRLVIAGFAAETGDEYRSALEYAQLKLARKGCDLLMCNEVGTGKVFGQSSNEGYLLHADGTVQEVKHGSKQVVAAQILAAVELELNKAGLPD